MPQHRKSKVHIKSKVHTKSKSRKHSKSSQRGGFSNCSSHSMPTKENMTNTGNMHAMPSMPATPMMKGGSIASDIVMGYSNSPPVMNDYANGRNIRESWYDDSLGAVDVACQKGGSPVSNLVMNSLGDQARTVDYVPEDKIKGDMASLNLYQTTGGARRRRKSNRNSKKNNKRRDRKHRSSKRSHRNERRRSQRGGHASDWIMSQYSQGPINNPSGFDKDLWNPPTLGLAGSGSAMGDLEGANVKHVGSPLV